MLRNALTTAFFRRAYQQYQQKDVPLLYNQEVSLYMQHTCLHNFLQKNQETVFGKEHCFREMGSMGSFEQQYTMFKDLVQILNYEDLHTYITMIKNGAENILRQWETKYLSTTSGTTSGKKYIPITPASMQDQIAIGKNAITACFGSLPYEPAMGKMFFLSGSPELSHVDSKVPHGRLSGIVHKETPALISAFSKSPSYKTNTIEDFATKIDAITHEHLAHPKQLTMIAWIPSYLVQYMEMMLSKSGKATLQEALPNLSMLVIGGVNPAPYKQRLIELLWTDTLPCVETYPASEGFIAYQDTHYPLKEEHDGLLLQTHKGIFFEFVPLSAYTHGKLPNRPPRKWLWEVEIGVPYALILNTNAGLRWYEIGDVIEFTSLNPYRIKFVGRTGNYTSAFGEHVIESEINDLSMVAALHGLVFQEYTVAPRVSWEEKFHEWFVELAPWCTPTSAQRTAAAMAMDSALQAKNEYYRDLRQANTIQLLRIRQLKPGSCTAYLQAQPGFDPQKKLPHVKDNRSIADRLTNEQKII